MIAPGSIRTQAGVTMELAKILLSALCIFHRSNFTHGIQKVRILGGDADNLTRSGYGQLYRDGTWYSLCDHGWGDNDAGVFCRQLGYDRGVPFHVLKLDPGAPAERIWRAEITCSGDEERLDQCTTRSVSKRCRPASVTCDRIDPQLKDGTLRLADGPTPYSGRVDVAYQGLWGSICDRFWDETTAGVVCNMLGYNEGGMAITHSGFGEARQVFLDAVRCAGGHETNISQCMSRPYLDQFCKLGRTAGVICLQEFAQNLTGQVKLVDGQKPGEGVVKVSYYGVWGGICSDNWDDSETRVVCRQLGYETGTKLSGSLRRNGEPSWLGYVRCHGNESSLVDCQLSEWNLMPCDPEHAIRIECRDKDLAVIDPEYNAKDALILYSTIPSAFVLLATVAVALFVASRKQPVHRFLVSEASCPEKDVRTSTRNPAYRIDPSFAPRSPTTPTSGIYNYILDDEKDSMYLELIDEENQTRLKPRSDVPLPVPPCFDEDNYLRPITGAGTGVTMATTPTTTPTTTPYQNDEGLRLSEQNTANNEQAGGNNDATAHGRRREVETPNKMADSVAPASERSEVVGPPDRVANENADGSAPIGDNEPDRRPGDNGRSYGVG